MAKPLKMAMCHPTLRNRAHGLCDTCYARKRHYGLAPSDFEKLFKRCKGRCLICYCELRNPSKLLHIDHDKKTGRVRGILCQRCNQGLGLFEHAPWRLKNALRYMRSFEDAT